VRTGEPAGSDADDELAMVVAGCRASHVRLLDTVAALDDDAVRGPSRLAGWSIGHVLTHLRANAESHTRMLGAAARGEAVEQYPGGPQARAEAIAAGAGAEPAVLRDEVRRSAHELEAAWAALSPEAWDGHGLTRGRPWACRSLPYARWREVEIHHVDMGAGYEPAQWPDGYVARELRLTLDSLPDRLADAGRRRAMLAWLVGRAEDPGPLDIAPWESRPTHYLRGMTG